MGERVVLYERCLAIQLLPKTPEQQGQIRSSRQQTKQQRDPGKPPPQPKSTQPPAPTEPDAGEWVSSNLTSSSNSSGNDSTPTPTNCASNNTNNTSNNTLNTSQKLLHEFNNCRRQDGRELFEAWRVANLGCVWDPDLVWAVGVCVYVGALVGGWVLVGGDSRVLNTLTHAWVRALLNPPEGFIIAMLGEVTGSSMTKVPKGQFTPLGDALCWVIQQLTSSPGSNHGSSNKNVIDADTVRSCLIKSFPALTPPENDVIHSTISTLIKQRKVFHTGRGYGIVMHDTYMPCPTLGSSRCGPDTPPSLRVFRRENSRSKERASSSTRICKDGASHASVQTDLLDLINGASSPSDRIIAPSPVPCGSIDASSGGRPSSATSLERQGSLHLRTSRTYLSAASRTASLRLSPSKAAQIANALQATTITASLIYEAHDKTDIEIHNDKGGMFSKLLRVSPRRRLATFSAQFPPPEWIDPNAPVSHQHSIATQTVSQKQNQAPIESWWCNGIPWAPRSSTLPRRLMRRPNSSTPPPPDSTTPPPPASNSLNSTPRHRPRRPLSYRQEDSLDIQYIPHMSRSAHSSKERLPPVSPRRLDNTASSNNPPGNSNTQGNSCHSSPAKAATLSNSPAKHMSGSPAKSRTLGYSSGKSPSRRSYMHNGSPKRVSANSDSNIKSSHDPQENIYQNVTHNIRLKGNEHMSIETQRKNEQNNYQESHSKQDYKHQRAVQKQQKHIQQEQQKHIQQEQQKHIQQEQQKHIQQEQQKHIQQEQQKHIQQEQRQSELKKQKEQEEKVTKNLVEGVLKKAVDDALRKSVENVVNKAVDDSLIKRIENSPKKSTEKHSRKLVKEESKYDRSNLQLDLAPSHMNNSRKVAASPLRPHGITNNYLHNEMANISKGSSDLTARNMSYRDVNKCEKQLCDETLDQVQNQNFDEKIKKKTELLSKNSKKDRKDEHNINVPENKKDKSKSEEKGKGNGKSPTDSVSITTYPSLSELNINFSSLAAQKILRGGVSVNSLDTLLEVNLAAEKTKKCNKISDSVKSKDFGFV